MDALKYLAGYSETTLQQVRQLITQERVGEVLARRYSGAHDIKTDKALYVYVSELKNEYLRNAEPVSKVLYDNKIKIVQHALGLHTAVSRVQGGKLKAKRDLRRSFSASMEWLAAGADWLGKVRRADRGCRDEALPRAA